MGHFADVCWSKSVREVNSSGGGATNGSSVDRWFLGALSGDSDQNVKWKVHLQVNCKPVEFITAISKSTFDSLPNKPKLRKDSPFQSRRQVAVCWTVYNSSDRFVLPTLEDITPKTAGAQ